VPRPLRFPVAVTIAALVLTSCGTSTDTAADRGVDCAVDKCVALTFDDGPGPFTDRLVDVLGDADATATFFLIGNKVAANPDGAKRLADAGMEIGNHTWEHPNMTTIPAGFVPAQMTRANDAITAATGQRPVLWRPPGGLTNEAVNAVAAANNLAGILWDVIPFDWINDADTAATRYMLMTRIRPGSVVLFHDTYSSTVDLVQQFIPVLEANDYHLVTVSDLLGARTPGSVYGGRENGAPVNMLQDIQSDEIPTLPVTPSPAPMPNFPITDIPGANSGGPTNGA
jgi:peptidoglycan/xylan/chitin deacetylase (PgdA/CDA1 family)